VILTILILTSAASVASHSNADTSIARSNSANVQQWIATEDNVALPVSSPGCFTMAFPNTNWTAVPCNSPPRGSVPPMYAEGLGDQQDRGSYSLSSVKGSFVSERGYQSEQDSGGWGGILCLGQSPDWYSLQLNTNYFTSGAYNWWDSWVQFGLQNAGCPTYNDAILSTNEWLVGYLPSHQSCPSGFLVAGSDCIDQATFDTGHYFDPAYLTKYTLQGNSVPWVITAKVCDNNVPQCWALTQSDALLLSGEWTSSEFNVLGYGDGTQANFGMATSGSIVPKMQDSPSGPRTCGSLVQWTAETNNLYLGSCTAGTSYMTYAEASNYYLNMRPSGGNGYWSPLSGYFSPGSQQAINATGTCR